MSRPDDPGSVMKDGAPKTSAGAASSVVKTAVASIDEVMDEGEMRM